jgi:hypothetical protein
MEAFSQIGKWIASVLFIVLGLLYLNGAAGSWWVSWGPPTEFPEAWEQRAIAQLGYAIALLATAPMAFITLKQKFNLRSSKYKYWWVVIIVAALSYSHLRAFLFADSCLDSGGSWQSIQFRCQHE